jgi:hypothetical protein
MALFMLVTWRPAIWASWDSEIKVSGGNALSAVKNATTGSTSWGSRGEGNSEVFITPPPLAHFKCGRSSSILRLPLSSALVSGCNGGRGL